jgi:hypothetical protein
MPQIIAPTTSTGVSADFTLIDGASTTLFLKDDEGVSVPPDAIAVVQIKSGSEYFSIGTLDVANPARVLQAPGTFRIFKHVSSTAVGVDRE